MSAPAYDAREADFLGFGFIAVKASEYIGRALQGERLDSDQRGVLAQAKQLLMDISSGARIVSTGVNQGLNPSNAVNVLSYSINPIEAIQEFIQEEAVHDVLDHMAESLDAVAAEPIPETDKRFLRAAASFFEALHRSLIRSVDRARRTTSRGLNVPPNADAHG